MPRSLLAGLAALVLGWPSLLFAQSATTAAIRGSVHDPDGAPVPAARVEATLTTTGASAVAVTDSSGRFHMSNLRPGGPYTVTATALGYAESRLEGVHLQLGQTLPLRLAISRSPIVLEQIEARAAADPIFNPVRTGSEMVVPQAVVEAKPTVSRDFLKLAELSPLAKVDGERISVAGQNDRYNAIQIDGTLAQDLFGQSPGGVPGGQANLRLLPLEAVQEYQLLVAPFDVRQSGFVGGLVNAVTRGGTNEWTATVFGNYRDENFLGELDVDGSPVTPQDFLKELAGFAVGGPLKHDRVHLFAAGEFERRRDPTSGFNVGTDDPVRTALSADSAATAVQLLRDLYGYDAGGFTRETHDNPIGNLFLRVDAQPNDRHRVTARHTYAGANLDGSPMRQAVDAYELGSSGYDYQVGINSSAVQVVSVLGERLSNDLLFSYTRLRETTEPLTSAPRIEVDINSRIGKNVLFRRLRAGAGPAAQLNSLDQDILGLRNDLSIASGEKVLTVGGALEYVRIGQEYLPGAQGTYRFGSLNALRQNTPELYEVTVLRDGADPRVSLSSVQASAYAQNEWTGPEGITLSFGMRADLPMVLGGPETETHPRVNELFEQTLSSKPATRVLISPRFGFNWQSESRWKTQLRGGAGLFTGRPPFVWIASAYAQTGTRAFVLSCSGADASSFDPASPRPSTCADGSAETAPMINGFSSDFRYPREVKISLGVDQRLPWDVTASAEVLYSQAGSQIIIEDLNIGKPVGSRTVGYTDGFGFNEREVFGRATVEGFEPIRKSNEFGPVLRMRNGDGSYAYAAVGELQRSFGEHVGVRAGYAYSRARDYQSLVSADPALNLGLNPTSGHPNLPEPRPSDFDRPHKVTGSVWGRLGSTELSLFYVGQSGRPYSYTYFDDINADGYPGLGAIDAHNDLLYVPRDHIEFPGSIVSAQLFVQMLELEPCLKEARGTIVKRNSCRAPFQNRMDLRVNQAVRIGGTEITATADVVNVLNLMNSEWGRIEETPSVLPILTTFGRRAEGRSPDPTPADPLVLGWSGPVRLDRETGAVRAALPYVTRIPESQWQAQLGLRIRI